MKILPLEQLFQKIAQERPDEMPHMRNDYFTQYQQMLNVFRTQYYNKIDAGLAALSDAPGFYTAHDAEHFDEVVVHAGHLLNITGTDSLSSVKSLLNPYELYLLLAAIRVHDVGNMYGRDKHEKKCFQILQEMGAGAGADAAEKKIISRIAQAHGGKTPLESKDTIGALEIVSENGHVSYRPRLLAGIVRIADEICENRRRAAGVLLENEKLPKHSEIYHRYASSITANRWRPTDRTLNLKFEVKLSDVERPWGCENRAPEGSPELKQVYLLDEIFSRLEKMDRERRYCNMYTREVFTIDNIRATIEIVNDDDHEIIEIIAVPELSDRGYPDDQSLNLKRQLEKYCGATYGASLREKIKA